MHDDGKVILRFRDGRTERIAVAVIDAVTEVLNIKHEHGGEEQVPFNALKAVFFPRTVPEEQLDTPTGSLIAVEFADGEVIRGSANYNPGASGFFLFPHDRSKNERIFVVRSAIASIEVEKL
ncbi:MAG TPA: hypothetical protein VII75_16135 [Thermoanaerobaculia bacterium]|nr:hypothetical protein [Thermoanaerobaculia bacterium]